MLTTTSERNGKLTMKRSNQMRSSKPVTYVVAATMVAVLLAVTSPAAAQESGRPAQPFDSTPVQPVAGAGSAFRDHAPDWSGGASDPVGGVGSGNWTATDLSHAGSWVHGGSSGAFSYTYGMRTPPAAGPAPDLGLSYSSATHDGRTSGTNNQASWVGDGWSLSPSFVERSYIPCTDDKNGNQGSDPTGDLCWADDSPSITIALDGVATSLVRDDNSGQWKAQSDANWRIQHLGSPATASSASSERWVITTPDGTKHYFASEASSRWTVPVFGNHSGEPCYKSGDFAGSRCSQAYRWMLDKSVDVHGNLVRYIYQTATGRYATAGGGGGTASYVREGWLQRIEYGLREGASTSAAAKVEFTVADRCLSNCRDGSGDPRKAMWPDTPWDLHCAAGASCQTHAPVFFSSKRLTGVATYVNTPSGFEKVDSWALSHQFKDYGDEEQVVLWLSSVQHTGHVGGTQSTPPVQFGGMFFENRVDAGEAWPSIWRPRLTSIKNETGGVTTINYSDPDCGRDDLPSQRNQNSRRCFPATYTPPGLHEPVEAWFHKYVVDSIAESDATGGGDTVWTFFDYATSGGGTSALWAWNDAEFVQQKDRTWSQWRGYAQVTTRVGDPADPGPQLRSRTRYFRGLDGDKLPTGTRSVSVTDSQGNTATDHRALAGMVWETAAYDDTTIIGSSTTWYWRSRTASRSYDGGKVEAFLVGPSRVDTRTKLSANSWRQTRLESSYDQYGRVVRVDESGDLARSGDERCIRTSYTDNTTAWLLQSMATSEIVSVPCSAAPQRPRDVVSAVRAFYDGNSSHTGAPSRGLLTRVDVLDRWDGGPVYATVGRSSYDALGREVTATDAHGATTTIAYTPAGAGPITQVASTNPAGHVSTTRLNPAWGVPVEAIGPNQARTVAEYDPLGRRTAVWLPGRDPATKSANLTISYQMSQTAPTAVTARTLLPDESYRISITLYDSLLRHRQTQTQTYGGRLISQTVYDSYGRVRFSSQPVFNNQSGPTGQLVWITRTNDVARTELFYDGAGRLTDEVFVVKDDERWRTSYRYGGHHQHWLATMVAPEGGTSTATLTDARGRTVELRQYHQRNATGAFDATRYEYHPAGQLARVIDPAGNRWQFEYDLRGRLTTTHDPDTGTSTTEYNQADQVSSTTDANGVTQSYVYDALGRRTQLWDGAPGSGELLVEQTYDGATNGKGLPHTATRFTDGQEWKTEIRRYDTGGRPTQVFTHLPAAAGPLAGSYWQSYGYYPDGSLLVSNAIGAGGLAPEPMTYFYNELGQPDRVTSSGDDFGDGRVYVDNAVYSPYGQLLQRTLGDPDQVGGVAGQVWQTWIYEEGTGRLSEFYFDKDTAGEYDGTRHGVAALSYQYDDAGNIRSITDQPVHTSSHLAPETQCFQYDHLRRLTQAWAQAGTGACASTPSGSVVGGPGAYWSSYEYDKAGNRLAETRWAASGSTRHQYSYAAPGQPQPHLATGVTATGGGGAQASFSYDEAGYTTSIDRDGQLDTLSWNPIGRLDAVETSQGTTEFFDGPGGNRVLRKDPNGDLTAWVAGYELTYRAATASVQATRYYQHGGETIGVRNGRGDIQWLAGDHHGTNQWSVNGDTLTVKVRRFDPFGNPRSASSAIWPDQRGFVGGIDNKETGLTTVGAREYDAGFGRFLSRDPILDFDDPQQLNGYAYANNNPVSMSDPSGLLSQGRGPAVGSPGTPERRPAGGSGGTPQRRPAGSGIDAARGALNSLSGAGSLLRNAVNALLPRSPRADALRNLPGAIDLVGRACRAAACPGHDPNGSRGPISIQGPGIPPIEPAEWEQRLEDAFRHMDDNWGIYCWTLFQTECLTGDVGDKPIGAIGVCRTVSGSAALHLASVYCLWYTRDDGLVVTEGTEAALGAGGISATGGLVYTSASSAEALAGGGWTWGVNVGKLVVTGGVSRGRSDAGDWALGVELGLGAGGPAIGGHFGGTETEAVTAKDDPFAVLRWIRSLPFVK